MQRQILYTVLTQSVDRESYMFILKSPRVVPPWLAVCVLAYWVLSVPALEPSCLEVFVVYIRHFALIME